MYIIKQLIDRPYVIFSNDMYTGQASHKNWMGRARQWAGLDGMQLVTEISRP